MKNYEFTEMEIDAIGEISNISLGSSASALSMLVRQTVDITPPRVEIIEKRCVSTGGCEVCRQGCIEL